MREIQKLAPVFHQVFLNITKIKFELQSVTLSRLPNLYLKLNSLFFFPQNKLLRCPYFCLRYRNSPTKYRSLKLWILIWSPPSLSLFMLNLSPRPVLLLLSNFSFFHSSFLYFTDLLINVSSKLLLCMPSCPDSLLLNLPEGSLCLVIS